MNAYLENRSRPEKYRRSKEKIKDGNSKKAQSKIKKRG